MASTEQLERESEQARQELAETLEELRARITPGQLVDQLAAYAREGHAAEFLGNLKRQVVSNPVPVAMVGAGIAWLMLSKDRESDHLSTARSSNGMARAMGPDTEWAEGARKGNGDGGAGESIARSAGGTAAGNGQESPEERVAEAKHKAGGMIESTVSSAKSLASSAYDAAAGTYRSMADRAGRSPAAVADAGHDLLGFCRDQPLVMAGLGLALGAALGALLPATGTEERVMGQASDRAKEMAKETAAEVYDKARSVGQRAFEAGKDAAEEYGLLSGEQEPRPPGTDGASARPAPETPNAAHGAG